MQVVTFDMSAVFAEGTEINSWRNVLTPTNHLESFFFQLAEINTSKVQICLQIIVPLRYAYPEKGGGGRREGRREGSPIP